MDTLNRWSSDHEEQRAQASREELVARLAQATHDDGISEPLEGLRLHRASAPTEIGHGVSFPSFCVIAQGSKEVLLGDKRYWYDTAHYLIATTALPIAIRIAEASEKRPYLSVMVTLDPALIGSVMIETGYVAPRSQTTVTAIDVSPLDAGLLDTVVRLVRLLEAPSDARFLGALLKREIVYRLLRGEQRGRVAQMAALGGGTHRIAEALEWLRRDFNRPLRIEEVARELGMSASGFHHHFRALTAMSPLQFQKQLRLQEARRLMLGEGLDAASAGYRVGYDDAAYFNREYKKLFGEPPMRDVERLRDGGRERVVGQGTM
jgi:AraC-like DNA-binding protein